LYTDKSLLKKRAVVDDDIEVRDFQLKWAEFCDNDKPGDDLRPMLGLDAYEAPPKPMRIHAGNAYDSGAIWRQRSKQLIDYEIQKITNTRA
jgi:hypothetical protein